MSPGRAPRRDRGARLGHRDLQPALAQGCEHVLGERPLVLGEDRSAELLPEPRTKAVERAPRSGSARTVTSTSSMRARSSCRPPASRRRPRRPARLRAHRCRRRAGVAQQRAGARAAARPWARSRARSPRRSRARAAARQHEQVAQLHASSSPGAAAAGGITVAPPRTSACLRSPSRLSPIAPRRRAKSGRDLRDRREPARPARSSRRRPATAATVRSSCVGRARPRYDEIVPARSCRPARISSCRRGRWRRAQIDAERVPARGPGSGCWRPRRVEQELLAGHEQRAVGLPAVTSPRSPVRGILPGSDVGRASASAVTSPGLAADREDVAVDVQRVAGAGLEAKP